MKNGKNGNGIAAPGHSFAPDVHVSRSIMGSVVRGSLQAGIQMKLSWSKARATSSSA